MSKLKAKTNRSSTNNFIVVSFLSLDVYSVQWMYTGNRRWRVWRICASGEVTNCPSRTLRRHCHRTTYKVLLRATVQLLRVAFIGCTTNMQHFRNRAADYCWWAHARTCSYPSSSIWCTRLRDTQQVVLCPPPKTSSLICFTSFHFLLTFVYYETILIY